jgi:hypothetical protein
MPADPDTRITPRPIVIDGLLPDGEKLATTIGWKQPIGFGFGKLLLNKAKLCSR